VRWFHVLAFQVIDDQSIPRAGPRLRSKAGRLHPQRRPLADGPSRAARDVLKSVLGRSAAQQLDTLPTIRRQLYLERLGRFPEDDDQIAPTRLGNAIRRLEWYAQNRYCMDSQTLWYELVAVAPEQVRRDESQARTNVDFYVCLLYGHVVVAVSAFITLGFRHGRGVSLAISGAVLIGLTVLWYRFAVAATDDWASAVRALVNLGRKPLAEALGLQLPATIKDERAMWAVVYQLTGLPYPSIVVADEDADTGCRSVPGDLDDLNRFRRVADTQDQT
jgi:hypothetical protein